MGLGVVGAPCGCASLLRWRRGLMCSIPSRRHHTKWMRLARYKPYGARGLQFSERPSLQRRGAKRAVQLRCHILLKPPARPARACLFSSRAGGPVLFLSNFISVTAGDLWSRRCTLWVCFLVALASWSDVQHSFAPASHKMDASGTV